MDLIPDLRNEFDRILEGVLAELPVELTKLFDEIPLVVEDRPSDELMARLGVPRPEYLRGLHTGIPLTRRSVRHSGTLPTVITIYRLGICTAAGGEGRTVPDELAGEIRRTILHELGHYFGLGEEDLRKYGYA
jgi:predicted Zn-dependent protease with MMP-like domain